MLETTEMIGSRPPATDGSVTRMLLASDGSTTRLLQAITGQPLAVQVDAQGETRAAGLPPAIRAVLGLTDDGAIVVERRSRLLTPERRVVSINHVVLDPAAVRTHGAPDLAVPIGIRLRGDRVPQFRELVGSGTGTWLPDGASTPAACAFKAYLIHDSSGGLIYVHESFNPGVVPPPRLVGPGSQPR
ncbi:MULTISPECIES: chorismate pyruvate-lyase family protein [Kitasatospora]